MLKYLDHYGVESFLEINSLIYRGASTNNTCIHNMGDFYCETAETFQIAKEVLVIVQEEISENKERTKS